MATSVTSLSTDGGTTKKSGNVVFVATGSGLNFQTASANAFSLHAVPNTIQALSDGTTASSGVITFSGGTGVAVVGSATGMDFSATGGSTEAPYAVNISSNAVSLTTQNTPYPLGTFSIRNALPTNFSPSTKYLLYYEITTIFTPTTPTATLAPASFTTGIYQQSGSVIYSEVSQYYPGATSGATTTTPGVGSPNIRNLLLTRNVSVSGTGYFTLTTPSVDGEVGESWDTLSILAQSTLAGGSASFQNCYIYCIGVAPT